IDGLDGVAAGLAFAAAAMAFVVGADAGQLLAVVSAAALAGAVAGFLVYNFSPASIFMGDTGSMFLGYVLAASALLPRSENGEVALVAFVVALGVPILDTLAAIARRASRGVPLFVADREHLHHRLLDLGLSQRQVSLTLWSVGALLAGTGATLAGSGPATMLVAIAVAGALAWVSLGRWGFESTSALRARRRRNVERRRAIRVAGERLRRAKGLADLAETLQAVGVALGARSIRLHFDASEGSAERVPVRFGPSEDPVSAFRTTHGIFGERSGSGSIEVVWREGCTSLDRDSEIAIELLCDHLAAALRHLDRAAPRGAAWLRELRVTPVPHGAPRRTVREHVDRASPG
ncbi:MAG TPA: MraY family glycosyltransferase, partial [Anaeromyxobacteraceae bacterium]|nr:MraY family glycosyltransferase [Anaeromyxobacteraceae bacterium]